MLTTDKLHDHRRLGRELDIFDTDPLIGAGLPFWLPAGAAIRHALEASGPSWPATAPSAPASATTSWSDTSR